MCEEFWFCLNVYPIFDKPVLQSGKLVQKEPSPPDTNTSSSGSSGGTANYRKFNIEPYSPKELEWGIVAAYKTKGTVGLKK